MAYQPVFMDIETTGLNPLAQAWHNGETMDAQVTAVGLGFTPNWRDAQSREELKVEVKSITDNDEYYLLGRLPGRFSHFFDEFYGKEHEPFFVGHNIRDYDFPYLGARYARLRLNGEPILSEHRRLDTMRVAANDRKVGGQFISEDDYCDLVGVESDDPYDGSDMPEAFANGEWDKINTHVISDVRMNAELFFERREVCMETFNQHYDEVEVQEEFVDEVDL